MQITTLNDNDSKRITFRSRLLDWILLNNFGKMYAFVPPQCKRLNVLQVIHWGQSWRERRIYDSDCTAGGRQAVSLQLRCVCTSWDDSFSYCTWETNHLQGHNELGNSSYEMGQCCRCVGCHCIALTAVSVSLPDFPAAMSAGPLFHYYSVDPILDLSPQALLVNKGLRMWHETATGA